MLIQRLQTTDALLWIMHLYEDNRGASSEFVSSSIPSWQILTAHAQPFRGASDLAFCLNVPLDSLLVWASSGGSGETARMRRLAWTFAARIGDKYQIRLTWPNYLWCPTWETLVKHVVNSRQTNKMTSAPAKTQIRLAMPSPSLIRVYAVRSMGS